MCTNICHRRLQRKQNYCLYDMIASMSNETELLRQRYFREYQIWKVLDNKAPLFRYVQEPVFSLVDMERELIEFLHNRGLRFTLRPRHDPASFITAMVQLGQTTQKVQIELGQGIAATCSFMTVKNTFASDLKGWLDRFFGSERYNTRNSVSTRFYVYYSYVLPIPESYVDANCVRPVSESYDSRTSTHLFNFDARERCVLEMLERAVLKLGNTFAPPLAVLVYPRQSSAGSIELVLSEGNEKRQGCV